MSGESAARRHGVRRRSTVGDFANGCIFGGEATGVFEMVLSAGEIVGRLVAQAEDALRAGARRVAG